MKLLDQKSGLVVALGAILLLAFVGTSVLNFLVAKESLRRSAMDETLPLISDSVYSEIQQSLFQPVSNSSLMAHDTFLQEWVLRGEKDVGEVVRYLSNIRERYGYFTAFFVSESSGNYYYYDGILKQISKEDNHDVWFYAFRETGKAYDLDVDTDQASGGVLTVFINHRLEDHEGNFLGVTGVGLKMEELGQTLASFRERYGRLIYMVDAEGLVQAHPDQSLIERVRIVDEEQIGPEAEAILAQKTTSHSHEIQREGMRYYVSARYFPDFEWFLLVEQHADTGLTGARSALLWTLGIGGLATGFALLLTLVVLRRYQGRLERLATTDGLTGICNRRHFMELAQREMAKAQRYQHGMSLILLDADHFKSINDRWGHDTGDQVLRFIAQTLHQQVREVDILARIGGEEFVVLLPRASEREAFQVAERFRQSLAAQPLGSDKGSLRCTVSLGVYSAEPGEVMEIGEMIHRADTAMYEAKRLGRNRCVVWRPPLED